MLVNDEPVTAWEIEQRAAFVAATPAAIRRDMKAKAEARWAQIVKDPQDQRALPGLHAASTTCSREEQAKALQAEFVKKLQAT